MSMKALSKIDKYYPILLVVMVVLAFLAIYTFRSIFSALTTAYEVEATLPDSELRINEDALNKAEKAAFEREIVPLNLR